MILWWIRILNEFEVNGNSLERIQQYLEIEHEPKPRADRIPPAYWPASGNLIVEKLSARYSADGPRVLHEISFEVKSGERVGIGECACLNIRRTRIDWDSQSVALVAERAL